MLIAARKTTNLTQAELSIKLQRPQSYVSKYERGERRLDLIEFLELAEVLKIDPLVFIQQLKVESIYI
ncbi:MAG: XRE family transcriptional regulator [Nostocales cyanobacterium]|nr:MAG: XRE family transcriptional regulator [Nostocales cyanobacterium]